MSAEVTPTGRKRGRRANRLTRGALVARVYRYWRKLERGRPGTRFQDLYDYRHRRRLRGSGVMRWLGAAGGILLVVVGLAIGWLPGPGGVLSLVGLAVLAGEVRMVATLLDRIEVRGRRIFASLRRRVGHGRRVFVLTFALGASALGVSVANALLG